MQKGKRIGVDDGAGDVEYIDPKDTNIILKESV